MTNKDEALVIFGLNNNTACKTNDDGTLNKWYIYSSEEIIQKIQQKIDEGNFSKVIFVDSDSSLFNFTQTLKMNIKVFGKGLFSVENEITIIDHDGNVLPFNGNQLDFLLPPDKTNMSVAGIDLVGLLSNSVVDLSNMKYYITFNPTLVKSYKDVTYSRIKGFCKIEK